MQFKFGPGEKQGTRQISSAPSPGGEGWDEGGQLFAPQRHNLIRQKKSVVHPERQCGVAIFQTGSNGIAYERRGRLCFLPLNTDAILAENLIVQLETILEPLTLGRLFARPQPLAVELGCGDASFLAEYARQNPGINFIGVERLLGRIQKLHRKGTRLGLTNVRGVRIESSYFLQYLLPRHSAQSVHVYFPDPWPKKKHRRHRLINEGFPALAEAALEPGGVVYLRTDDEDYFTQMNEVFDASARFAKTETPDSLVQITTDFERGFNAQGIPTLRVAYRLR
jgi:tRNA (guanine-N7-)-methyltransferase